MKRNKLMDELNKRFGMDAVDATLFYGYGSPGIWLRNADFDADDVAWERKTESLEFIERNDWHIEPYDSETMIAYENS